MTSDRTNRRVILGMPGYGKQTASAGRGFWRACRDMSTVCNYYQNGSLLAANFNALWCLALNMSHRGDLVTHFAMLHDDIGPEDWWLDSLIDEMESKQLDVLGVAVPIKDNRGLTSMALHDDRDDWMPLARLSMYDLYELPETFTSKDLGHPLLLNTGCWVVKWDQEWCRTVHFEIHDRIVFNRAQNRYQAQTIPEDWHFSRQLHEIGQGPTHGIQPLRIGATRKIALKHEGEMEFLNTFAWGVQTFDKESSAKSPVFGAFPHEISGWLLPREGKTLADLATGKQVLEIGSYCGRSTVCLARTAEHVTAVDYFDGRGTPSPQNTLPTFKENLKRYGVSDKVSIVHPDAEIPALSYDLAFIDGAHDYESVTRDVNKAREVLAPDGLIVFHDYKEPYHPGIEQVVDDLLLEGASLISTIDTLAVVRPPACIPTEV